MKSKTNPKRKDSKRITDKRYTITKEYCGLSYPAYVVRFCGDWVAARDTREEAEVVIVEHKLNFWNHNNDEN